MTSFTQLNVTSTKAHKKTTQRGEREGDGVLKRVTGYEYLLKEFTRPISALINMLPQHNPDDGEIFQL